MKKILSTILCFLILFSCAVPVFGATGVPKEVMDATKSVVRILSKYYDGSATGSGFVIKNEPGEVLIVTNDHVVAGNPYSISVWVSDDELVDAEIVFTTSAKDLCVLRVTESIDMKPLTLSTEDPEHGAAIYVVGYPGAGDILSDTQAHTSESVTITDGIISAIRTFTIENGADPVKLLQVNAAINSGNSGGPLFDSEGVVIGVNTYKVNANSQGVFGSVDISELWELLEQHGIEIATQPQEVIPAAKVFPVTTVLIAAGAVSALTVVFLFVKTKKKKAKTLRKYMEAHPNGLGVSEAVSLLLPVAIQIRDLHNNGKLHLQVSPDSIMVSSAGVALKESSKKETDRHAAGFAAPEIYKGVGFGASLDIYSFTAVLYFAATGKLPANSLHHELLEMELALLEETYPVFAEILRKGMAQLPQDRIQSMQELIYGISSFSTQKLHVHESKEAVIHKQKKEKIKKQKKPVKAIPIVVITGLGIILVALLWKPYVQPQIDARNEAIRLEEAYIAAVSLMEEGRYEEAMEAFAALTGYKDSEEQQENCRITIENAVLEEKYLEAKQLADNKEYGKAAIAFAKLDGYRDAREKSFEMWKHVPGRKTVSWWVTWWINIVHAIREDGTIAVDTDRTERFSEKDLAGYYTADYKDIVSIHGLVGLKFDGTLALPEADKEYTFDCGGRETESHHLDALYQTCIVRYRDKLEKWTDIVAISECIVEGAYSVFVGLRSDGTVLSVGTNDDIAEALDKWTDIISVSVSDSHVVGLKADGTVVAVGNNEDGQCEVSDWVEIKAVLAADETTGVEGKIDHHGMTFGLRNDGTVIAVGSNFTGAIQKVRNWKNIKSLSFGKWSGGPCGVRDDGTISSAMQLGPFTNPGKLYCENIAAVAINGLNLVGLKIDGTLEFPGIDHTSQFARAKTWTDIQIP